MDKFSTICNVPIRYTSFGKGEKTILLLHGYLEAMEVWEHFGGLLGKKYNVVALDLPGSGWSGHVGDVVTVDFMADVAAGVLSELGVEKVTVVGHSMGGYVAISLAQRYADRVEKLVLLHSTPNADSPERAQAREREIELIKEGKKEVLARVNPARGFAACNVKKCEEEIESLCEQIIMSEDDDIIAVLKGLIAREDKNEVFGKLTIPRLMIFGDMDNYIPKEVAQGLAEKFEPLGVQIAWVEQAGHMSFVEHPKIVEEILGEFIEA